MKSGKPKAGSGKRKAKGRRSRGLLSEQLRRIIEEGPMSRYRLSKESGVDASQLCRFVKGKGRLTTRSLDRIGEVLELKIMVEKR